MARRVLFEENSVEERTERRQRYRVAAPDVGQHSFSGSPAVAVSYGEPSTEKEKSRPTLRNGAVRIRTSGTTHLTAN